MGATSAIDISIIIPCYNDAPHLTWGVDEVLDTLRRARWTYEIILVNDASPDNTREVIEQIIREHPDENIRALHHEKNTGRGRAVADGVRMARGQYAGFIDIDLEVHARYIPAHVQALEKGADLAVAYRVYRVRPGIILRAVLSKAYIKLVNRALGNRLRDTEAGYKFFRRDRILSILDQVRDDGWFWDTEMMVRSQLAGLKIEFVPALFLRRNEKPSTVRLFSDSFDYFRKLMAFRAELQETRRQQPAAQSVQS